MIRITDILEEAQRYLSHEDIEVVEKAYIFSAQAHFGQERLSKEPYLIHPLEVTAILVGMRLDVASLATGLLHDTIEDTLVTISNIEEAFGKEIAFLVDGLTKISKITFASKLERQAENFRKMMLAMSSDIRILLIRLADRIHNMRTLDYLEPEKQKFIARETLEVYAPLAHRLGINWMKIELEDLSFKYLQPEDCVALNEWVAKKKDERDSYAEQVRELIRKEMGEFGLAGTVEGRAKHLYSISKKMKEQHINFDQVYDLMAFRIILDSDTERDCYAALSMVHALWKPVPGRFKDYIAMPKANNYRSLHTTVIGPYGERVEIQIRTREMHEWADKGIAAHWRYKEGRAFSATEDNQIKILRELLEVHQEGDAREFMRNLKLALYPDEVYVFTPRGDVKPFPKGATPIDFAYSVHTDVGNQCVGARVNRNIVPLHYKLQNGDTVEIITQPGHLPSKDWMKNVVTSRAIAKIKQFIKTEERENSISLGREIFEKELKKHRLKFAQVVKTNEFKIAMAEYSLNTLDDMLALIGYGKLSAKHVANRLVQDEEKKEESIFEKVKKRFRKTQDAGVSITGIDNVMVRYAKCCGPIPGDEIVGCITRGRGVTVHVASCPSVQEMPPERIIDVHWEIEKKQVFSVSIRVRCGDRKGLLSELTNIISSQGVNITYANIDTIPGQSATCDFQLAVNDLAQLNKVLLDIRKLKSVTSVERLREPIEKSEKDFH